MKKNITLTAAIFFVLSTASLSFAASVKCSVDSIEGDKVTLTCKDTEGVKVGDKVKIKLPKAEKPKQVVDESC